MSEHFYMFKRIFYNEKLKAHFIFIGNVQILRRQQRVWTDFRQNIQAIVPNVAQILATIDFTKIICLSKQPKNSSKFGAKNFPKSPNLVTLIPEERHYPTLNIQCNGCPFAIRMRVSVTRLDDLLHFGKLFKAFGNNYFAHILRQFL